MNVLIMLLTSTKYKVKDQLVILEDGHSHLGELLITGFKKPFKRGFKSDGRIRGIKVEQVAYEGGLPERKFFGLSCVVRSSPFNSFKVFILQIAGLEHFLMIWVPSWRTATLFVLT